MALIVGNGTSRKDFDLRKFRELFPEHDVWGCNAIYRDYIPDFEFPDFLVAIDDGMIQEIEKSTFPKGRFILPPIEERWEPFDCNSFRPRSNAGINAIREAYKRGSREMICIGFDFLIHDEQQSISNLYDGTLNYGPNTRANFADHPGRINYLRWTLNQLHDAIFIFAYPKETWVEPLLGPNMQYCNFETIYNKKEAP